MVFVLATIFLSLGLINLDVRDPRWWRGQRLRLLVGVPLVAAFVYVEEPPLVFPQALSLVLLTLVPNALYSAAVAARTWVVGRRTVSIRKAPIVPYIVAVAVLGAYAGVLFLLPDANANGLRDLPAVTTSQGVPPAAALRHIRVVPEESAEFAGDKVIGQDGTYYRVGSYSVQFAEGALRWVAPLEFHDLVQWVLRGTSPGVIVVSAENPDAAPEYRKRQPLRYVPSAFLNANLYRHVWLRYGTQQILECSLQLDDHGDPQYVCALGAPTIGWSGTVLTAVVIVDPATGAMQKIARDAFATLPAWVSRVYPPRLALAYNDWFGRYAHGFWNSLIGRRDVHLPARPDVYGLLVRDDRFVWFVDHTSPSSLDQSMTGFTYMDARTGAMTYYTASGGEFSSQGALAAVHANPIVRQGRLLPTQPILYNAFGQNTWVVPIVAESGKYQTLGLVQAVNGRVFVGNVSASSPAADAFAQYQAFLGGRSEGDAISTAGTLDRVATQGGRVLFTLRGDRRIFVTGEAPGPAALLARPGDVVRVRARRGEDGVWNVETFANGAFAR